MCIIGRLSNLNPAFVMPTLRKVLIQILTELEYSGIGRNKEQSAKLLGHLISNAPKLIRPYQEPVLKVRRVSNTGYCQYTEVEGLKNTHIFRESFVRD